MTDSKDNKKDTTTTTPACVDDFERYSAENMSDVSWGFYSTGADDNITRDRNKTKFNEILLKPKMLRKDVSKINTEVTLVGGTKMSAPIGLSPTALHVLAHPDGEIGTVKGAMAENGLMTMSCWANSSMEEIMVAAKETTSFSSDGPSLWFNTYLFRNLQHTFDLVEKAYKLGFKAVAISIDINVLGKRRGHFGAKQENLINLTAELKWPPQIPQEDEEMYRHGSPWATWADFQAVVKRAKLPIIAKGVLTAEDANLAVQHGAAAIWVSNHGGRQLDSVPATIEVLPSIVKAVDGRVDVYMDSGVRTGGDIFKAIALGAKAAFVGRPVIWALKYDGANGVARMISLLKEELRITMALAGCTSVKNIDSSFIYKLDSRL